VQRRAQVPRKLLFLLGGSAAFEAVAEAFVPAAGGTDASIALLMQGGSNWEKYVPEYTTPWARRGVTQTVTIVPGESGELDLDAVGRQLSEATGIFIGGGHTPTHHRLYAAEPVRTLIRERYEDGVPVAGVSAGARIALERCVLTRDETGKRFVRVVPGLDLVSDVLVGVHFSERNSLPDVLEAMSITHTGVGLGIDEPACAVFEQGEFAGVLGQNVHEIRMASFESKEYVMRRISIPYSTARAC
jgi:cyanophycinase